MNRDNLYLYDFHIINWSLLVFLFSPSCHSILFLMSKFRSSLYTSHLFHMFLSNSIFSSFTLIPLYSSMHISPAPLLSNLFLYLPPTSFLSSPPLLSSPLLLYSIRFQLTGIHCGSSCACCMMEQSCMQASCGSSFTSTLSKNCLYLASISLDASSSSTKSSSCRRRQVKCWNSPKSLVF